MFNRVRERNVTLFDEEVHSMFVAMEERRNAYNHLIDENTESPPIDSVIVTVADNHFRSKILSSTAEGVSKLAFLYKLGETEIGDKQVP